MPLGFVSLHEFSTFHIRHRSDPPDVQSSQLGLLEDSGTSRVLQDWLHSLESSTRTLTTFRTFSTNFLLRHFALCLLQHIMKNYN